MDGSVWGALRSAGSRERHEPSQMPSRRLDDAQKARAPSGARRTRRRVRELIVFAEELGVSGGSLPDETLRLREFPPEVTC